MYLYFYTSFPFSQIKQNMSPPHHAALPTEERICQCSKTYSTSEWFHYWTDQYPFHCYYSVQCYPDCIVAVLNISTGFIHEANWGNSQETLYWLSNYKSLSSYLFFSIVTLLRNLSNNINFYSNEAIWC